MFKEKVVKYRNTDTNPKVGNAHIFSKWGRRSQWKIAAHTSISCPLRPRIYFLKVSFWRIPRLPVLVLDCFKPGRLEYECCSKSWPLQCIATMSLVASSGSSSIQHHSHCRDGISLPSDDHRSARAGLLGSPLIGGVFAAQNLGRIPLR